MERIKKTSMQDVADYLGISKNTVSLALNSKPGVSEKLRAQIVQAARDLNYGGLSGGGRSNRNILVIAPNYVVADRLFYPEIIWGIEREARAHGLNAIVTSVTEDMEANLKLPNLMFEMDHQGVLVIGVVSQPYLMKLASTKTPMVQVDTYDLSVPCTAVVTENVVGAYTLVEHLIDQGHTDIGFIGPIDKTSSNFERWTGYNRAMRAHNLNVPLTHCLLEASDYSVEEMEIDSFVGNLHTYPTAWFCANDRMAISLIHVLDAHGIRVPDQVSVVGFDDAEAAVLILPKLTTFRVPREAMCKEAVRMLLTRERTDTPVRVSIYGELVVRDSVRKLEGSKSAATSLSFVE